MTFERRSRPLALPALPLATPARVSGVAIREPLQTHLLLTLFGAFPTARLVYFIARLRIVAFLPVHPAFVARLLSVLIAMITGCFGRESAPHTVVPT
jgi:thiosulfate reductase cytochrome b subunit